MDTQGIATRGGGAMTYLCPQCRVMPVKVPGDTCSLLCAQEYAERPAAVQLGLWSEWDVEVPWRARKERGNEGNYGGQRSQ